jgi:hypothetical protein
MPTLRMRTQRHRTAFGGGPQKDDGVAMTGYGSDTTGEPKHLLAS